MTNLPRGGIFWIYFDERRAFLGDETRLVRHRGGHEVVSSARNQHQRWLPSFVGRESGHELGRRLVIRHRIETKRGHGLAAQLDLSRGCPEATIGEWNRIVVGERVRHRPFSL